MYIMIRTLTSERIRSGEVVVLKEDKTFGQVGAFSVGGGVIGYITSNQPEGCMDSWRIVSSIADYRILCKVAIVVPGAIILHTDSKVFESPKTVNYSVKEGYGIFNIK